MRMRMAAAVAAVSLGVAGCGGDDNDEPAKTDTTQQTTTTERPDPAIKREFLVAVTGYNRGYDKFVADLRSAGGSLDTVKADIADYRTVIYEFDKDIRAIRFPDDLVPQVNAILESNRNLIAQLDSIADAKDFDETIRRYEEFQDDRKPTVNAVNRLIDQL